MCAAGSLCAYDPRMSTNPSQFRAPGGQSPTQFREKLGVYLVGVAIGFVLLGFFTMKKRQALEAQEQRTSQPTQEQVGESTRDPAP